MKTTVTCPECKKPRKVLRPDQLRTTMCHSCSLKAPHTRQWNRQYGKGKSINVDAGLPEIHRPHVEPCCNCGKPSTATEAWSTCVKRFCAECIEKRERGKKERARKQELKSAGVRE